MAEQNTENKKKVLLIGPSTDLPLIGSLEEQGYEVIPCDSPQKAWGFVYPIRPRFIILHLEAPSSRDVYAIQECRALADGVPVIVACVAARIKTFVRRFGKRPLRFLSLPLQPDAIKETLGSFEHGASDRRPKSPWRRPF